MKIIEFKMSLILSLLDQFWQPLENFNYLYSGFFAFWHEIILLNCSNTMPLSTLLPLWTIILIGFYYSGYKSIVLSPVKTADWWNKSCLKLSPIQILFNWIDWWFVWVFRLLATLRVSVVNGIVNDNISISDGIFRINSL